LENRIDDVQGLNETSRVQATGQQRVLQRAPSYHVLEHPVQRLHVHLNQVQHRELGLGPVAEDAEVQRGEVPVHQLGVRPERLLVVHEAAQVVRPPRDDLVHRLAQLRLLVHAQLLVEAAQADHRCCERGKEKRRRRMGGEEQVVVGEYSMTVVPVPPWYRRRRGGDGGGGGGGAPTS
jgi:hypothetical protein